METELLTVTQSIGLSNSGSIFLAGWLAGFLSLLFVGEMRKQNGGRRWPLMVFEFSGKFFFRNSSLKPLAGRSLERENRLIKCCCLDFIA